MIRKQKRTKKKTEKQTKKQTKTKTKAKMKAKTKAKKKKEKEKEESQRNVKDGIVRLLVVCQPRNKNERDVVMERCDRSRLFIVEPAISWQRGATSRVPSSQQQDNTNALRYIESLFYASSFPAIHSHLFFAPTDCYPSRINSSSCWLRKFIWGYLRYDRRDSVSRRLVCVPISLLLIYQVRSFHNDRVRLKQTALCSIFDLIASILFIFIFFLSFELLLLLW